MTYLKSQTVMLKSVLKSELIFGPGYTQRLKIDIYIYYIHITKHTFCCVQRVFEDF